MCVTVCDACASGIKAMAVVCLPNTEELLISNCTCFEAYIVQYACVCAYNEQCIIIYVYT